MKYYKCIDNNFAHKHFDELVIDSIYTTNGLYRDWCYIHETGSIYLSILFKDVTKEVLRKEKLKRVLK